MSNPSPKPETLRPTVLTVLAVFSGAAVVALSTQVDGWLHSEADEAPVGLMGLAMLMLYCGTACIMSSISLVRLVRRRRQLYRRLQPPERIHLDSGEGRSDQG